MSYKILYMGMLSSRSSSVWHLAIAARYFSHTPVMAPQIVQLLKPEDGKVFIDMTFGGGGHTRSLLETNKSIKVIAVDRDPVAYRRAQQLSGEIAIKCQRLNLNQAVIPIHGKFSEVMKQIHLSGIPYDSVNGVIFDLGASSMQYDDAERGFSLSSNGPLDMRMDTSNSSEITAEDVVNNLDEKDLIEIFKIYGEERKTRKIVGAILDARAILGRIRTTQELARIVASVSSGMQLDSLGRFSHPATKIFQALRMFVNNELNELNYAIDKIRNFLIPTTVISDTDRKVEISEPFGIAAVLTFHSLEDRIVKRHFSGVDVNEPIIKSLSQHDRIRTNELKSAEELKQSLENKNWMPVMKHVMKPSEEEKAANARSRSAKLRVAVRLA